MLLRMPPLHAYHVYVTDKETGDDRTEPLDIKAEAPIRASEIACEQGWLVRKVELVPPPQAHDERPDTTSWATASIVLVAVLIAAMVWWAASRSNYDEARRWDSILGPHYGIWVDGEPPPEPDDFPTDIRVAVWIVAVAAVAGAGVVVWRFTRK